MAVSMDIIDEVREQAHIREFAAKQRAARRYNSKVAPREMKEGDLVLKQVVAPTRIGKLFPNWEGPYRIREKLAWCIQAGRVKWIGYSPHLEYS
jgi:hypothetical protein